MAKNGDIYMGVSGDERYITPYGRKYTIKPTFYGRSGTTFDGSLYTDTTGIKYTFELMYSMIDGHSLDEILTLYDLHTTLNLRIYKSSTTWFLNYDGELPTVRIHPISRTRLIMLQGGIWENVNVDLQET